MHITGIGGNKKQIVLFLLVTENTTNNLTFTSPLFFF